MCAVSSFKTSRFVPCTCRSLQIPYKLVEKMTLSVMPNAAENRSVCLDTHGLHFIIVVSFDDHFQDGLRNKLVPT